ncbi:MAG: efflux RND transporter periplasmic adaptor subunit [Capsulimonadales bacterium]|nr:efflux RND transporter periplasmic adaptor subunit [Capsulimonadales bacterium]
MKRWIFIIVPVLVLLTLVGWRVSQKQAEAAERVRQKAARANAPVNVETIAAARRDVINTFEAVGSVEAPYTVDLKPEVTGKVFDLTAREGDRVSAGQVIARVDAPDLVGNLRRAEAALAEARARLAEAQANTNPTNVALQTDIQRQRAAVNTARAQERQARASADAQVLAARASVTDAQGRVASAEAGIARAEAAIATAKSNLENARVKRERQEALFKEGATARQNLDDARTAEEAARGALEEAVRNREAAVAVRDSAVAQKQSAMQNVEVVRNKAEADVAVTTATVRQNEAGLVAAQANTARTTAYRSNLEALRAAVAAADSDVRTGRNRLADTILRSPMDGIITKRYVDPGALVSPAEAVVAVQRIRNVWVTIAVPEEVRRYLTVGQTARITLDALPGDNPTGRILRIDPGADPASRQFTVRIALGNRSGAYRPGTFARVLLETERVPNAISVPREAITETRISGSEEVRKSVTVIGAESKVEIRPIRTGITDGRHVVVAEGLREGEQVVTVTGRPLKEGQVVQVEPGGAGGRGKEASGRTAGSNVGKESG